MNVCQEPTTAQGLAPPGPNVSMNQEVSDAHAVKAMTSIQQHIIVVKVTTVLLMYCIEECMMYHSSILVPRPRSWRSGLVCTFHTCARIYGSRSVNVSVSEFSHMAVSSTDKIHGYSKQKNLKLGINLWF